MAARVASFSVAEPSAGEAVTGPDGERSRPMPAGARRGGPAAFGVGRPSPPPAGSAGREPEAGLFAGAGATSRGSGSTGARGPSSAVGSAGPLAGAAGTAGVAGLGGGRGIWLVRGVGGATGATAAGLAAVDAGAGVTPGGVNTIGSWAATECAPSKKSARAPARFIRPAPRQSRRATGWPRRRRLPGRQDIPRWPGSARRTRRRPALLRGPTGGIGRPSRQRE